MGSSVWSRHLRRRLSGSAILLATLAWPGEALSHQPDWRGRGGKPSCPLAGLSRTTPRTAAAKRAEAAGPRLHGADEACGPPGWNFAVVTNQQPFVARQLGPVPGIEPGGIVRLGLAGFAVADGPAHVAATGKAADAARRPPAAGGHFSLEPELDAGRGRPVLLNGDVSLSGTRGRLAYTLGLLKEGARRNPTGLKLVYAPDGDLLDYRVESQAVRQDKIGFTGSLKYEGPSASVANLNLSFGKTRNVTNETSDRTGRGLVHRIRYATDKEDGTKWEFGLDYLFKAAAGQLKIMAILRSDRIPRSSDVVTYFADASPTVGSRFLRASAQKAAVGRAEFRWANGPAQWQWIAQGSSSRLEVRGGLLDVSQGRIAEVPLAGASGTVREGRGETEISLVRPLGHALTMQGMIGAELSRLRVASSERSERTSLRARGFIVLGWAVSPRWAVTARLARSVGQLSFLDFFSSKQLRSGDVTSGNTHLVPPTSWDAQIEARRTFGAFGSGTLRLYAQRLTGALDYVTLDAAGEAVGNIDRASLFGAEIRAGVVLDAIGLTGTKVEAELQIQESRVRDPVTRNFRRISNDLVDSLHLGIRRDVKGSRWGWGASYIHRDRARTFRPSSVTRMWDTPGDTEIFVENKNVMGLTMRLTALNLLGSRDHTFRHLFLGWQDSPLARTEYSFRSHSAHLTLSISGKF